MTDRSRIGPHEARALARGAAVLGTGGGGAVDACLTAALAAVAQHGPVPLLDVSHLADEDVVVAMSLIGAPTVGQEVLPSAGQPGAVLAAVRRVCEREPAALMPIEIGGSNGVAPVAWAARRGLPLLDADGMGRAFPEGQMTSFNVAGIAQGVIVLADVLGNVSVLDPVDAVWAERQARALCVASGATSMMADHILTGQQCRTAAITGSLTRAIAIGEAVDGTDDPLGALVEVLTAQVLIEGKVVDVERTTTGGFARGSLSVEGSGDCRGRMLRIEIQNENLIAFEDGAVRASVPDLITVVDTQSAAAIFTENLTYGQRVSVLAWACDPVWRTPRGLQLAGPRAFGYDVDHRPVEAVAPVALGAVS